LKGNLHHREHPTKRLTFAPHGTLAAAEAAGAAEDWQMDNAGAEAAATAAGGAAEDGPGAAAEAGTDEASGVTRETGRIPMAASEAAAAAAGGAAED